MHKRPHLRVARIRHTTPRRGLLLLVAASSLAIAALVDVSTQPRTHQFALDSAAGLRLHNVTASAATLDGKKGVRVRMGDEARAKFQRLTPEERGRAVQTGQLEQLAVIEGVEFDNGVIEAEIAGAPQPRHAVHLAPGLDLVTTSDRGPQEVRVVRRSGAGCLDERSHRGAGRAGTLVRP